FGFFKKQLAECVEMIVINTWVNNRNTINIEVALLYYLCNTLFVAEQNGFGNTFFFYLLCSFQNFVIISFGKHHTLWILFGTGNYGADEFIVEVETFFQILYISLPVSNSYLCHTRFHSCTCHSRSYGVNQSRV